MMKTRVCAVFADAPIVFFAVVVGVALTFRIIVGDARAVPVVVPTFATGSEHGLAETKVDAAAQVTATPAPSVEVGAAVKVQPFGTPAPARVAPKPRGHGRKPNR